MKENNNEKIMEITRESSKEEISQFLSIKFKFSEKIKENILKEDISGDILPDLKDKEFNKLGLKLGQIKKVKNYLEKNTDKFIEKKISKIIDENSGNEDVDKFFKQYIGFNGHLKDINGKKLLTLRREDILNLGLNLGQRKKLEKYIKIFNKKNNEKNSKSKVINNEIAKTKDNSKSSEISKSMFINRNELNKETNENDKEKELNNSYSFFGKIFSDLNISGIWKASNAEESNKDMKDQLLKYNKFKRNSENLIINPKGNVLSFIQYQDIISTIVQPLYKESQFNIFLILVIGEEYYNSSLSFYEDNSCLRLWKVIINYNYIFLLNEEISNDKDIKKRVILVQIPTDKQIHRLSCNILNIDKKGVKEIQTQIEIEESVKNYFFFQNLNFGNLFNEEKKDFIMKVYFDFFISQEISDYSLTKDFIQSAINFISSINNTIYFNHNNLFKLFKLCSDFNLKINNIELIDIIPEEKENNIIINKEYLLTGKEIDNLFTLFNNINNLEKLKEKLSFFFVSNYIRYNKKYLKSLIQSRNRKIYLRNIFNYILKGELKINEINFKDKREMKKLIQDFLSICENIDEINYIIKFEDNLFDILEFINKNIDLINNILEKEEEENKNKVIILPDIDNNDNLDLILKPLSEIVEKFKNKTYSILNYEKLFNDYYNLYSDKSIEELCKLKSLINIFDKKNINDNIIENYYIQIHQKGINLIKSNKLNEKEIIQFIKKQDTFYIEDKYKNNIHRDPTIFKYINIIDNDKNIELLKKNQILEIFLKSNNEKLIILYTTFLSQINKIKDFEYLFKLFPEWSINRVFINLINKTFENLINSYFNEESITKENGKIFYDIFQKILIYNSKNGFDVIPQLKLIESNFQKDFVSNFYIFLIKEKSEKLIQKIKNKIIAFFIEQQKSSLNPESLIYLALISPDSYFFQSLLNQMDNFILNEKDFYQKEENPKFILFKLFYEKCSQLIKNNQKLLEGRYIIETMKLKSKITYDLESGKVEYDLIDNLMDEEKSFFDKILILADFNEDNAKKLFKKIKENLRKCKDKFNIFENIADFYSVFYKNSKMNIIKEIKENLKNHKQMNLIDIIKFDECNFIKNEEFNLKEAISESENIKYKYSCFFMAIYREYEEKNSRESEDDIFNNSIVEFEEVIKKIVTHKKSGEIFFKIKYIDNILKCVRNKNNDMNDEIDFLCKEFPKINQENDNYIRANLLNDLINYSYRDNISILINGIIYFLKTFNSLIKIKLTETYDMFKHLYNTIISEKITSDEIKKIIQILEKWEYYIKNGKTALMEFYELLIDKKESLVFIKKIIDTNLDIRNLNEFIDEQENSQLQTSDIDNLLDIYTFFYSFFKVKKIINDKDLLIHFKKEFEREKNIDVKLKEYLKCYGEIIQFYQLYHENPEITIQKIDNILNDSYIHFEKNEKNNLFSFKIKYLNQNNEEKIIEINELKELRNKIYMSSTNTNLLNSNYNKIYNQINKENITNQFVNLIDNMNHLNNTLNSLIASGYPFTKNFILRIRKSLAFDEKDKSRTLKNIFEEYKMLNKKFKKSIKKAYETMPLIRLFFGNQFILLYNYLIDEDINISNLINCISLSKIKNFNFNFNYNNEIDCISNINIYLELLFNINKVDIDEIYNVNKVLENLELTPGLYRKIKTCNYSDLSVELINLYYNLTGNYPIVNTLLFCNEETSIEQIRAFLYRAFFCRKPILFTIANMENLRLSITQNVIKILKKLYKLRDKSIDSYLLFIYEKNDSGLSREIEKLISDRFILNNNYFKQLNKRNNKLDEVIVYSSLYAGYGKTTEIIYKIRKSKGLYFYLPIGGEFTRDYIIKNLENLNLPTEHPEKIYLHIDLSDSDKDELINELLFKLIILRYIDSNDKIFSLNYYINIIIEIPKGFINFQKKYKILNLFKQNYIDKLHPIRLEPNAKNIRSSSIAIVAEVLNYYEQGLIGKQNIDLDSPINMKASQCEKIINKYFKVENQNYYQKMNFIKILSLQFIKFTENVYFNYQYAEEDGIGSLIENARISVIQNFIMLTKVFTRSPFDQLLIKKQEESISLFEKFDYDKNKEIEKAIYALENEKQEIFSFDLIKPSLVFFNRDGGSLSIISNNDKNDPEYKGLQALWNSRNKNPLEIKPLIDYKKLKHEALLNQIKILFSLDNLTIEQLKQICEEEGNYIFVCDNFIKMVRILLNIEAKIPVILMGETGVGKTKILEMLATLYGKGKLNWKKLEIHAGTTNEDIISFIDGIMEEENKKIKKEDEKNELTWVFLDEINTCNSLGLIAEIMCNHTYLGKKINDNFIFLGACNPYRVINKKMRESGLVYYNKKEKNKLNNLVYSVNPLPHSLLNFVFDFGSLRPNDERKYIENTISSIINDILNREILENISEEDNDELSDLIDEIVDNIVICHNFIREKYDRSSVSLREIRRFGVFFEYFINYFKFYNYPDIKIMKLSLNMTLYLCYYLRLNDKSDRKELSQKLNKYYPNDDFLCVPEKELTKIGEQMTIDKNKGIALNRTLKENLFTCFTCIINKVPLIIIGKPGTGKSLSFQILYNSMKGEYSEGKIFRDKGKLYRFYYQGSETSTAEGIKNIFKKALKSKLENDNKNKKIISLVFFDEMGLAERSINNPLKIIHFLLEKDSKQSVPFLGTSNWKLDASKTNRTLTLSIIDYDISDLQETAICIAESMDEDLANKYSDFFNILAKTYNEYILLSQNNLENKNFHGNRDFYNLIKNAMSEIISRKDELNKNEKKILNEIGNLSLERNFGGLENSINIIKNIFNKEFGNKLNENNEENKLNVLDVIKQNILHQNSRYLMLISDGNDASEILKTFLKSSKKKYIELIGSKYKTDVNSGSYAEEVLNKIKYIMGTDNILILQDLEMIYPSLYDLFNQNFTYMGNKQFAKIAFEYSKISSEVNPNFHIVILVNSNQIQNLKIDPPFLNRFEKHIVNYKMLLNEEDIKISNKILNFINIISTYNNCKNLKFDLEKLLINCKPHDIEGLVFKIKNNYIQNKKNKKKVFDYEPYVIKEAFKKIAPAFCQDLIASLITSNLDKEYNEIKEIVLNIYKNSNYNNFSLFFKHIKSRKSIVYTFSKTTDNLFEEKKIMKNKFGSFVRKNAIIEMVDSIKSENDFFFLLESFRGSKNKKILILKFSENDLNKIKSVNYLINNYEIRNKQFQNNIIIFIIHIKRQLKNNKIKNNKKIIIPDLIPFINDEFDQIFIDNLQGKENMDIFKVISKQITKTFIKDNNFIDNKIYSILNYINFNILNETKEINKKNYISEINKKITENKEIKELIQKNIEKQGDSLKEIVNEVFTSDILEVNDIDFLEVIKSKLNSCYSGFLLNIIFSGFKENILNQLLINNDLEFIFQNKYFNRIILDLFNKKTFNFIPPIKPEINKNKVTIYNDLKIPKSKQFLDKIIKYLNDEICERFIINENSLRKNYEKEDEILEVIKAYEEELKKIEKNISNELNKNEFFKEIYKSSIEIKRMIKDDYIKYFIIKIIEKKQTNYIENENMLSALSLIVKIFLNREKYIKNFRFSNDINEFIKIIEITQVYKDDITNIIDIILNIKKFCNINIEDSLLNLLNENKIKYQSSNEKKAYIKIVNYSLFCIIESLIREILLNSIDLIENDITIFYDYFFSFKALEANLQKINKKYDLNSIQIYNLTMILKIYDTYKYNQKHFENNYKYMIKNILNQSFLIYNEKYEDHFQTISELNKIIDNDFKNKKEEYKNLLFYIYRQHYENINDENIKIKLIKNIFENKFLIKKSYIFLVDTMKDLKPKIFKEETKCDKEEIINGFLNLEGDKKLIKYKNLFSFFNSINSIEFNELLLYFFENQSQSYFSNILSLYNNQYTEECCKALLLNNSLIYLKKSIQYLYEHNDSNNNILKFYSIGYIKIYFHYYVEVNYNHFDKCNFDQINKVLMDENEKNKLLINMRNIYIFRLYFQKFENFEQFNNFNFLSKNIPIYQNIFNVLKDEEKQCQNYIFKNSFINPKNFNEFIKFINLIKSFKNDNNIIFDKNIIEEINQNFDIFYCCLVNNIISYLFGNNKSLIIDKMMILNKLLLKDINLDNEGKILFNILLDYKLFNEYIINVIADKELKQSDFEIFLYTLRFILNTQINNNKCFYNNLLKKNASRFIKENYIPGSFPFINEYIKAYNYLYPIYPFKSNMGYYICKDCGSLYEILPCSFPTVVSYCPNKHKIGGIKHRLCKKDIRILNTTDYFNELKRVNTWLERDVFETFLPLTLDEYKKQYVDKYLENIEKGILENFTIQEFIKDHDIRGMNIITFRVLNFILYSYLIGSYILGNINKIEMRKYLVDNLFPYSLFGIVKKNWELLDKSLKTYGIKSISVFINMIFNDIIFFMIDLKQVDTQKKLIEFEKKVDNYIKEIINDKNKIDILNKEYEEINNKLLNCNPQSMKEIIQSNYLPSIYSQKQYPDIQYYTVSKITNIDTFIEKFNLKGENKKKYALINLLINKDSDITRNAYNLKYLVQINNLTNILINSYSYKISREEAKIKTLEEEISNIIKIYNEANDKKINDNIFINEFVNPFIEGWNKIKDKSVQYKCRILRDLSKGEKPFEMDIKNSLSDFLIDDGDKESGMFLASAYQYLIESQNIFINEIVEKNNLNGILNSYISQLTQSINIQDATKNEIVNIDDNLYQYFNDLIISNSMRNIFTDNKNEIDYNNYNDIIFNFEAIEEELGKKILPGLKKFNVDKIKFITYLYEGFRGENSSILVNYSNKYNQRDLKEAEKDAIVRLLESNNNKRFYNDVFSSLQILMNEIIKENYEQDYLLYKIIEKLPNYNILNEELIRLLKEENEYSDDKLFTVNSLIALFNYFEALCWEEFKNHIPTDYKQELPKDIERYINNYFVQKNRNRIINKENFTDSLRKLISRSISSSRQDIEIKNDAKLKYYIVREDLWNKEIIDSEIFEEEINEIFKNDDILIAYAFNLYMFLDGDDILSEKLNRNTNNNLKKNKNTIQMNNLNKINIKSKDEKDKNQENESDEDDEDEIGREYL